LLWEAIFWMASGCLQEAIRHDSRIVATLLLSNTTEFLYQNAINAILQKEHSSPLALVNAETILFGLSYQIYTLHIKKLSKSDCTGSISENKEVRT